MKRNAKADLEMCEKATPGPWIMSGGGYSVCAEQIPAVNDPLSRVRVAHCMTENNGRPYKDDYVAARNDARFIAESREALPYWIKRAQEAEDLLESIFRSCGVCFTKTDCEECKETEKRIKQFLGIDPCDK